MKCTQAFYLFIYLTHKLHFFVQLGKKHKLTIVNAQMRENLMVCNIHKFQQ
jgi:hypothetical protein